MRRAGAAVVLLTAIVFITIVASFARGPVWATRVASRAVLRVSGIVVRDDPLAVLQSTLYDCGPAALATVLNVVLGHSPSVESLMSLSGTTHAGTSLSGLTAAAERAGLRVRAMGGPLDSVTPRRLPAIAFVDDNHFVVIRSYEPDGTVLVTDPAVGTYRAPRTRLRERWSGHAMMMVPDSSTSPVAAWWGRPDPNGRAKSLGGDHGANE